MSEIEKRPRSLVWLVDDEEELAQVYSQYIADQFDTRVFTSAEAALKAYELDEQKPDVIVTDMKMPGMDGLSLIKSLRERRKDLPVILISGYAEQRHLAQAMENRVYSFLSKPCNPQLMSEQVTQAIRTVEEMATQRELTAILLIQTEDFKSLVALCRRRIVQAESHIPADHSQRYSNPQETSEMLSSLNAESELEKRISIQDQQIQGLLTKQGSS
jgi:two-component system response regulator YesN